MLLYSNNNKKKTVSTTCLCLSYGEFGLLNNIVLHGLSPFYLKMQLQISFHLIVEHFSPFFIYFSRK